MGKRPAAATAGSAGDEGGKKSRPAGGKPSPAAPGGPRQSTVLKAFAAAANKPAAAALEVTDALGAPISDYDAQNLANTFEHFQGELARKRRGLSQADAHLAEQERAARSRSCRGDGSQEATPQLADPAEDVDRSVGDEDAFRYLHQLRELTDERTSPSREQLQAVVAIMRFHELHGRSDLSAAAFHLLQQIAGLHPSVQVRQREPGKDGQPRPYLLTNSRAWRLTDCCESLGALAEGGEEPKKATSAFEVLARLIGLCHATLIPVETHARCTPVKSPELRAGELLLLRWLLSELRRDLRCRLAVFFRSGAAARSSRGALLQNSQLWRTFSDSASRMSDGDRRDLVTQLMQLIAAPAAAQQQRRQQEGPGQPAEAAIAQGLVPQLAAQLLGMLLELYSTAEDAGLFLRHGASRATTSGGLANVRMVLEAAMVNGLVGSACVLPSLEQKRAFLTALHPRERLRLLTMIVSKGHARRNTDGANYPGLERLNFLFTNAGDVDAYPAPQPTEALRYILDDLRTGLSYNLLDRTADGLALLVSQLAQAAAEQTEGVQEVAEVLRSLVEAFEERQVSLSQAKTLSPPALLSLHAAQRALALAY